MATRASTRKPPTPTSSTSTKPSHLQTTLVPLEWAKKNGGPMGKTKSKAAANGNIMAFFKKAEELNSSIFMQEKTDHHAAVIPQRLADEKDWCDELTHEDTEADSMTGRFNENAGSFKKRKINERLAVPACSPPPPDETYAISTEPASMEPLARTRSVAKKTGPFEDDSDSNSDSELAATGRAVRTSSSAGSARPQAIKIEPSVAPVLEDTSATRVYAPPPLLKSETTSYAGGDESENVEDYEDEDFLEGEEFDERRWMKEQRRLELLEAGLDGDAHEFDAPDLFPDDHHDGTSTPLEAQLIATSCPICGSNLTGFTEQETSVHVNACLDGNPIPNPPKTTGRDSPGIISNPKKFKRPPRPAKPGQQSPFNVTDDSLGSKSAFSTLMAGHAEDAAWASAAAENNAARGKPAYQRTCPFYKILPGFYIAVDAFRYGAVQGQNAYFLSHFHSDHYVGLTSSWCHGPIYCSKVTGNLVRQQLRVEPKWVVDLDFEAKTEVPGTQGVQVTMISANHCPGSSLFLFEKETGRGTSGRLHRVLHCGDFRACQMHIEHPLLKPDVIDAISGKSRQQKLDVCYLDTTYLNPKYAFPPQQQVIQACADMCVSLSKAKVDESDGYEQMKRERAGEGMIKFVRKSSDVTIEEGDADASEATKSSPTAKSRGRLLVIVGTYSIGKERICVGIAKALKSKVYAPPSKQRICRALEDPELNALLTKDPREAQVHMTPLFEIRADTLDDYLRDYSDHFSRAVGFRPSGWNYRPPKGRFTESPAVQTVLHSQGWKSQFTMRDLTAQRGSTHRAKCFGVPYSEHSSFRELSMFCCALRIDKIIPTVNVGSAKSREKMKGWCEKWAVDKKKNGLFRLNDDGSGW